MVYLPAMPIFHCQLWLSVCNCPYRSTQIKGAWVNPLHTFVFTLSPAKKPTNILNYLTKNVEKNLWL